MPSEPTIVTCESVADELAYVVEEGAAADPVVRGHVESCLRCQAQLVQYRKLLRSLHHLRTEVLEPAPGTLTAILTRLEEAGERGAIRSILSGRRAAYVGGLAVATAAAGAAGAIVFVNRRRIRLAS